MGVAIINVTDIDIAGVSFMKFMKDNYSFRTMSKDEVVSINVYDQQWKRLPGRSSSGTIKSI